MTREEAIVHIKDVICENNTIKPNMVVFEQEKQALCMAIKALEQEPCEDAVGAIMRILTELGYGDEENGADAEYMSALYDVAEKVKALPCDTLKLDGMLEDAYEHGYEQARHDYEVQPCEDAVSLNGVIDTIEWYRTNPQHFTEDNLIEDIKGLPPVTPKQNDSINAVLDEIKREFKIKADGDDWYHTTDGLVWEEAIEILDKYKSESEDKKWNDYGAYICCCQSQ